jgi:hypothetical protein
MNSSEDSWPLMKKNVGDERNVVVIIF